MAKNSNPLRAALFVTLAVFVVLSFIDRSARGKAQSAFEKIDSRMDQGESISVAEVHTMLGEPAEEFAPAEKKWAERYKFRGVFRSYGVRVDYMDLAEKLVEKVKME